MSKVTITEDQAKAIEVFRENNNSNVDILTVWQKNTSLTKLHKSIQEMTLDSLAEALYVGYEIEKSIRINEWVTNTECNHTFKIYAINQEQVIREEDSRFWDSGQHTRIRHYTFKNLRHATKEEIFWAELGREVGEFRIGDITLTQGDIEFRIGTKDAILDEVDEFSKGKLKGFYPADSFKEFPQDV